MSVNNAFDLPMANTCTQCGHTRNNHPYKHVFQSFPPLNHLKKEIKPFNPWTLCNTDMQSEYNRPCITCGHTRDNHPFYHLYR